MVVEDFNFESPKTKDFIKILDNLKIKGKKTLLLTKGNLTAVYKSGRNIPKVKILEADKASTYDIVNNQILLLQLGGVELINKSFGIKESVN